MTDRVCRIIFGAVLLVALYFNWRLAIYGITAVMLFEGVTNWRIPILVSRLQGVPTGAECSLSPGEHARIDFESERAMRLVMSASLIVGYVMFNKELWFFPWFIGFALLDAGLIGICPLVMGFRWAGFR